MNAPANGQVTPQRLMQIAWSYAAPLIIESAIRTGIFDTLDESPKNLEQVHTATGASTRGLAAIMNALCGLEFLDRDAQGRYSLTPESAAFLVRSKPSFMGGLLVHTSSQLIPKWLQLTEIVKTGKPVGAVNQQDTGAEFFQQFVADIFPMSYPPAQALAATLKLGTARVLDLAAGSGVWGISLAQSSPQVEVTAVDWPAVVPVTKKTAARFGLEDRFTFIAGDLHSADFGSGYNVSTLGHILHSEGESRSRALLKKTFEALAPGGTIAIAEFLVDTDRKGPVTGLFFAVNMLVNTDEGNTFSAEEIFAWLNEAGFVNPRLLDAPGPSPLILATKP
ncbi:MAG TPA: methyltransferase [Acidobacteriaceae bacterium]|nr:methyltransferase [Acidobacteriaceae bacterium]